MRPSRTQLRRVKALRLRSCLVERRTADPLAVHLGMGGDGLIDVFSFLFPSHDLEGKLQLVFQLECAPGNRDQFDVVVSLVQGEITGRP